MACTKRVRVERGLHEVDRMLALASAAGAIVHPDASLTVTDAGMESWQAMRAHCPEGPYAVLATTSRWPSKAWPISHWVQLAKHLYDAGHVSWMALPGSLREQSAVDQVAAELEAAGIPHHNFAGKTDVGGLMAMIEAARLTISNDSAALHMAMGLGERCLGLFGPTDPAVVGPWRRPDLAMRAPLEPGETPHYRDRALGSKIMSRLDVSTVAQHVDGLIGEWS